MKAVPPLKRKPSLNAISDFPSDPASVYLSSLASSGRRSVRSQLSVVTKLLKHEGGLEDFPWHELRYQHVARVRFLMIEQGYAINTINLTLAALRGVINAAFNLELVNADTVMRIKSVKLVTGTTTRIGSSLSQKEVARLIKSCMKDRSVIGARDTALMALMVTTGLRRNEVVGLALSDYEPRSGWLVSHLGKGRKRREVQLPKRVRHFMKEWLSYRGEGEGALFCKVLKNERVVIGSLTSQTIYNVVKARTLEAGVTVCTPHDLRRTYVTCLLDFNVDLNTVRLMVGHENIETTCRYDRRNSNMARMIEKII